MNTISRTFVLALVLAVSQTALSSQSAAPSRPRFIKAGRLFTGTDDHYLEKVFLEIKDGKIVAISQRDPGEAFLDLSNFTVLPGLIDCHTHVAARADRYDEISIFKDTPLTAAINSVGNAKRLLDAGFTTIRDLGSPPFLAVDLRNAIEEGVVPGPRIVASGPYISMTGGHGDLNGFSPQVHSYMFEREQDYGIADGADEVRKTVRAQLKYGVDVIKIGASGGVLSRLDSPGAPQFTLEELRAAVEEAHNAGRRVAAHAHGAQAIKNAIIAGVDSIEHASLVDEEGIRLAKAHGTFFVMDIYNDDYLVSEASRFGLPKENIEKEREVGALQRKNFQKAFDAGVRMAFGTDSGIYPHGENAKQFAYMVRFGMSPLQALRSATIDAAKLLGRDNEVGSIEPGKYADLIAVRGDPLNDISVLENVVWVMKGGVIGKEQSPEKFRRDLE